MMCDENKPHFTEHGHIITDCEKCQCKVSCCEKSFNRFISYGIFK